MLKKIKMMMTKKTNNYFEWEEYKNKITFLETFKWQQDIRKQSIKNSNFFS
ncbi:hypothetical protein KO361_01575 [Candidatus Woesearchaeota archaeon]|nr:hypothetical protein [Candidatus Woesearchaeota archaeon]